MPYVLKFNEAALQPKMRRLAHYLELPTSSFGAVLDWVLHFARGWISGQLEDLNIPSEEVEIVAAKAAADNARRPTRCRWAMRNGQDFPGRL
jgi:alcohol dehydrogenase class IV